MDVRPDLQGWNLGFFFRSTEQIFTSIVGVYVILGFATLLLLAQLGRWRWFILGCALYTSSFCFFWKPYFHTFFLPGFEQVVENGRPLTAMLLISLALPAFMTVHDASFRSLIRYGPVMFLVFQFFFCVRMLIGGVFERGIANIVTDAVVFWVAVIGTSQWMKRHRDITNGAWAIATAGVCFAIVTAIHMLIVPNQMIWQNRLISTSGTATFSSEICAITLIPVCYFVARPSLAKVVRIFLGAIAALLVVFLIWSGTRTGLLMAVVGLLLLFRLKIGRLFVAGMIVSFFVWVTLQFFGDALIGADRLFSTMDTRTGTWWFAFSEFLAHPILGSARADVQAVENSYVSILARTGAIGFLLFLVVAFQVISGLMSLQRMRRNMGKRAMDIDLITAGIVALAIGAMLEGYLLAAINVQLTTLFIYMSMMCTMLDPAKADEIEAPLYSNDFEYEGEYPLVAGPLEQGI